MPPKQHNVYLSYLHYLSSIRPMQLYQVSVRRWCHIITGTLLYTTEYLYCIIRPYHVIHKATHSPHHFTYGL